MKVKVVTHQGEFSTEVVDYNAVELEGKLNQRELMMVSIGDAVVNKNSIAMIIPVIEETTTVQ